MLWPRALTTPSVRNFRVVGQDTDARTKADSAASPFMMPSPCFEQRVLPLPIFQLHGEEFL